LLLAAAQCSLRGHDVITTKLTWAKEVSRVVFRRCAACHRPEGKAFSLLTYAEARPWAKAIQEQVLSRKMPPWNAVKGFGDFRHDRGLSQEEIVTISDWVEGGAPEGDPALLPSAPKLEEWPRQAPAKGLLVSGSLRLAQPFRLRAVESTGLAEGDSAKLLAVRPDGEILPLLWIDAYSRQAVQRYELADILLLPPGTRLEVRGKPGAGFRLIPSVKPR
jgi:hypothetical protein